MADNLKEKPTGRLMARFTDWQRMIHWTVAITFYVLALSGLIMLFGKYVLMPVFGRTLFSWLAILCKNLHITPLRKYDLHRESSGIPDVLAVEETLDHIGLPLATAQV